jgi:hypothetical protein
VSQPTTKLIKYYACGIPQDDGTFRIRGRRTVSKSAAVKWVQAARKEGDPTARLVKHFESEWEPADPRKGHEG